MLKNGFTACVAAGFLALASAPASASPVNITYSGKIESGVDGIGIFVPAGQSLAALPFTMTYSFDSSVGRYTANSPSLIDVSYGGSYFGTPSPLQFASLTINGVSQAFSGSVVADLGYWDALSRYYEATAVANPFTTIGSKNVLYADAVVSTFLPFAIGSIDQSFSVTGLNGARLYTSGTGALVPYSGYFNVLAFDGGVSTTSGLFADGLDVTVNGSLVGAPTFPTAPLPEPGTWALMIIGFGAIGGIMRRKRGDAHAGELQAA